MRTLLEERDFPVDEIRYFASARSAGTTLPWRDAEVVVVFPIRKAAERGFHRGNESFVGACLQAIKICKGGARLESPASRLLQRT